MARESNTHAVILDCARDLYLERGLAGFSMRKVAECAGLSATAIYRHFENKEALLMAVAEEGFRLFATYLWHGLEGATPLERLALTGHGYARFGVENPGYYRVIFMTAGPELWNSCGRSSAQRTLMAVPWICRKTSSTHWWSI